MTAFGLFLAGLGIFLAWCAIKGTSPKDVLLKTIGAQA